MSEEKEKKPKMKELPQRAPIVCSVCGSKEIAIIAEIHKCIFARIVAGLLLTVAIVIAFIGFKNTLTGGRINLILVIIFAALSFVVYISVWIQESRSHSKAICRDCGNIWMID